MGVTIDDARAIAATLPRSYEARVRGEVRFRAGRMVYAAFYENETIMGFGYPKEEREALVASQPDKFLLPRSSHLRYRWVCVRLDAIDIDELRRLLVGAWRLCVPKKVAAAYEACPVADFIPSRESRDHRPVPRVTAHEELSHEPRCRHRWPDSA